MCTPKYEYRNRELRNTCLLSNSCCDYGDGADMETLQEQIANLRGRSVMHLRVRQERMERYPVHRYGGAGVQSRIPPPLNFTVLRECVFLVTLDIHCLSTEVTGLEELVCLKHLHISWHGEHTYKSLVNLSCLGMAASLVSLSLDNCERLVDIHALTECTSLQLLHLQAPYLVNIMPISRCICLTQVELARCLVDDISPLSVCSNIHTISLSMMENLCDISSLQELPSLTSVSVYECTAVQRHGWMLPEFLSMSTYRCRSWCPSERGVFKYLQCEDCVESYISGHHVFVDDDMCVYSEEEVESDNGLNEDGMCDVLVHDDCTWRQELNNGVRVTNPDFEYLSDCGVTDDD
jgi:hypothetical protein